MSNVYGILAAIGAAWIWWAAGVAVVVPIATFVKREQGKPESSGGLLAKVIRCEVTVAAAAVVGSLMGTALGFVILSFNFVIGQSGTTGTEYVGYWQPAEAFGLASFFGALPGAFGMPLAYFACLRPVPYRRWPRSFAVGAAFTLVAGLIGALLGPIPAWFLAILGFLLGCLHVRAYGSPDAPAS